MNRKYSDLEPRILELRRMGNTYDKIASILRISHASALRYCNPNHREIERERAKQRKQTPEWRDKRRQYTRENLLRTVKVDRKTRRAVVRKRPYLGVCELHNEAAQPLAWHHWDDQHPEYGMWLCETCHRFVGGLEKGLGEDHVRKYLEMKRKLGA